MEYRHPIWQSWKIHQPPYKPTHHKPSRLTDITIHTFSTVNNLHSSSLQHDMHDQLHCHLNYKRNRRVSSLSTCFKDLSHMPLLDNYCICITRTLELPLEYFNRQLDKTCQLLLFPTHQPAAPSHLLSPLWVLPFLGDALRWLTGTAITKDVNSIKTCVFQLIENQLAQQETLVHIISILNVTRYATQINRHSINILMNKMDETSQDVNNLYSLTTSLATSLSYHQIVLYVRSVLANL